MNCNTTHYRANSSSVPGDPTFRRYARQAPAWKVWQGDGAAGKGALFVPIRRRDGERRTLVATHLQSRYPGEDYLGVRESQLRELSEWLESARPYVVAGDFNTPSIDPEYARWIAPLGFDATAAARAAEPGAVTNYATRSSAAWIDFVVASEDPQRAVSATTRRILNRDVDDPFSDHHGLAVELSW